MPNVQQPELRRSEETALAGETDPAGGAAERDGPGLVPEANAPGTPSGEVQDQPDLDAFRARFTGSDESDEPDERAPSATRGHLSAVGRPHGSQRPAGPLGLVACLVTLPLRTTAAVLRGASDLLSGLARRVDDR